MKKKNAINCVIIVDPAGSMGNTAEEEVTLHTRTFRKVVRPATLRAKRGHSPYDLADNTDLVVYDFGGMMPGSSLMEDNARHIVKWAEDHPNALVVVVSGFTYRNYIEVEMEENDMTLPNIVCDDGKRDLCDVLPDWWKESFGIETPDDEGRMEADEELMENWDGNETPTDKALREANERYEREQAEERERLQREHAAKQKVIDAENKAIRDELRKPVATITVPVACEWKPGQSRGFARFKIADSMVDVTEGDKEVAHMGGAMGGVYEITFPDGKGDLWCYAIYPEAFYEALKAMHEELLAKGVV